MSPSPARLAIVVSHPIQYYAPLYERLARRNDVEIRVFFTWHGGQAPVYDHGFGASLAWDVPLTEGYEFEVVPNVASDPGTHHFLGLRNPSLVDRVLEWGPDAVHVTGWAWASHLRALRAFHARSIPTLFRGDSHLLDGSERAPHWSKRTLLSRIYRWPALFLVAGAANRAYYEAFGVEAERLFPCSHSIDVGRFAEPDDRLEHEAGRWRAELGIADHHSVVLFAGKFERKKRPLELMRAVLAVDDASVVMVLVGGGELESEIASLSASNPSRFRVLPIQNQRRMPVVYRLGDLFALPSAYGETWGLAVNEALACGRPVLVSDRVGCAADVVDDSCGKVVPWNDPAAMVAGLRELTGSRQKLRAMREAARRRAWAFDVARTEMQVSVALQRVLRS